MAVRTAPAEIPNAEPEPKSIFAGIPTAAPTDQGAIAPPAAKP